MMGVSFWLGSSQPVKLDDPPLADTSLQVPLPRSGASQEGCILADASTSVVNLVPRVEVPLGATKSSAPRRDHRTTLTAGPSFPQLVRLEDVGGTMNGPPEFGLNPCC